MHNKNNNKTNTFIQGLRPFSSSIPKTLKKHLRKGGYNYSNIIENWTKMVGKKISDACYPIKIKMGNEKQINKSFLKEKNNKDKANTPKIKNTESLRLTKSQDQKPEIVKIKKQETEKKQFKQK